MRSVSGIAQILGICLLFLLILSGNDHSLKPDMFQSAVLISCLICHAPHDDILELDVSPQYSRDRALFTIIRGNLLRSVDAGQSWRRLIKGLDNKHRLISLGSSSITPGTLFLASLGDGVYKSVNGGDSWFRVNQGLNSLEIEKVEVFPSSLAADETDEVILAAGAHGGLYQTDNGGESWRQVLENSVKVTSIAGLSIQQGRLIVGDHQGILHVSNDHGQTWGKFAALPNNEPISAIAASPKFDLDHVCFVGTEQAGIYKTVDAEMTFSAVNTGLFDQRIRDIVLSLNYSEDSTLFVATWNEGVFFSDNAGSHWRKVNAGLTKDAQADQAGFQRPHFSHLRMSDEFSKDQTLFLGGFDGLFQSTDGGQSWQGLDTLASDIAIGLAVSPNYVNDNTVAMTTYLEGAYVSHDQGSTWQTINRNLDEPLPSSPSKRRLFRLFDILFSPNYAHDKMLFCSTWTYLLKSTNQGKYWQVISVVKTPWWHRYLDKAPLIKSWWQSRKPKINKPKGPFAIAIAPDFASNKTLFVGAVKGSIFKSIDGGNHFSPLSDLKEPIDALLISPDFESDQTLYAVNPFHIHQSTDGGVTWDVADATLPKEAGLRITSLAISPNYRSDGTLLTSTSKGVFKTTDRGKNWFKVVSTPFGDEAYVELVAISPQYAQDQTFLVSVRGKGIFKTVDDAQSFSEIGESLINSNYLLANPCEFPSGPIPIKFSPNYVNDQTLFGIAYSDLFKSTDGGTTWEKATPSKPAV